MAGRHWQSVTRQIPFKIPVAGSFAYGRTRTAYNAKLKPVQLKVDQNKWQVLIPQAHAGYIDWPQYQRNHAALTRNGAGFSPGQRGRLPRERSALLQGRLLCGRCGARMRVHYELLEGRLKPYYICNEQVVRRAGKTCQWVHGTAVDEVIGSMLLDIVAPAAIEVALGVQQEIAHRIEEADNRRKVQLERARHEAELARRRYVKVDPETRLVATSLEADWNERLGQLDALHHEHEKQGQADRTLLDAEARKRIQALAADFPRVWRDPRTQSIERNNMLGLLIEDVTLATIEARVHIHIPWSGRRTQSQSIERPNPIARIRKTPDTVVAMIDEMLETQCDRQITERLNTDGHRN